MRIKAKLYPYPLLESCFGQGDYVDSKFNIFVEQKNNGSNIELKFTPVLDNYGIQELINNGSADFAVHVESTLTSYRKLFRVKDGGLTVQINANDIENNISVCTFIIANKDLNNYRNDKFNEDYDGFSFNIEKGNVLAIGDSYELDINKEKDDIGNIQSIFGLIELKNEKEKDIKIDVSMEKINIALPKEEFNSFDTDHIAPCGHPVWGKGSTRRYFITADDTYIIATRKYDSAYAKPISVSLYVKRERKDGDKRASEHREKDTAFAYKMYGLMRDKYIAEREFTW